MGEMRGSAPVPATDSETRSAEQAQTPASPVDPGRDWIKSFLVALGLFLLVRTFLVEAFRIPTGSMENTLLVGDFLLVNKMVFGPVIPGTGRHLPGVSEPRRGDVVVFTPPHEEGTNYVKRLVGLPGDTLEMWRSTLHVNGRPQEEPYARGGGPGDAYDAAMFWQCTHAPPGEPCRPTRDNWGPLIVPAGHYFVMGDNRDDSEDSRYWGFVERDAIRGRPLFIYYSYESGRRRVPWLTAVRWQRIGHAVH